MGLISSKYRQAFLGRYDKDGIVPFLSVEDFPHLVCDKRPFVSGRNTLYYFTYHFDDVEIKDTILFLHGLGPGHTAYMAEIAAFCKNGHKVITLDYTGCDSSGGSGLNSLFQPTIDVSILLEELNDDISVVIGHSLGAFTALNIANYFQQIKKAVIMSGFLSAKDLLEFHIKNLFFRSRILAYERKVGKPFSELDNIEYLKNTDNDILFIHSKDDQMVDFSKTINQVKAIDNPHIKVIEEEHKKHNPNYSMDAVIYMNDVFAEYNKLVRDKVLVTFEDKKKYMSDKSAYKMTIQDENIINQIEEFIK